MPIRLLRPTLRQSQRWNKLPWFEQSLFIRLITLADDYGRYEAHPMLIRNEAFPYGDPDGKDVPVEKVDSALRTLCGQNDGSGLIQLYEVGGTQYLQINRWKERARSESKYPCPADDCHLSDTCQSDDKQMPASPPTPTPTPKPTPVREPHPESAAGRSGTQLPTSSSSSSTTTIGCWTDEFGNEIPECLRTARFKEALARWHQYRREIRKPYKRIGAAGCLKTLAECGSAELAVKTIEQSIGNGWQGLFPLKTQPEEKSKPFIPGGQNY
jgi:hypothetical protein